MLLATSAAIREAERALFDSAACSSLQLMDSVVRRLYSALCERLGPWRPRRVVAYVGRGNNAGDAVGLAAAFGCPLLLRGVTSAAELSADTQQQLARMENAHFCTSAPEPEADTLILDGLLGSGATGPLRPETAVLVWELNVLRAASPQSLCVAIDIPTGLPPGPGYPAVLADITCPIGCVKPDMVAEGAEYYVGQLLPIPLPEVSLPPCCGDIAMDDALQHEWFPSRAYNCFKNRAGRVAIVAGSVGMLGAAQLAAEAALAAGAGLVVLYTRPDAYPLLATRVAPEVMVRCVSSYAEIAEPHAQALLLGPGLGPQSPAEAEALHKLATSFWGTVVLDADALNTAAAQQWPLTRHPNWVLTPHPGEMRRLAMELISLPRREQVARFLERFDGTLLLKGARSLIADRRQCCINGTGGPFMANGGQGDVLSGAIAALAAQGLPPLQAAALGAHACGKAAAAVWSRNGFPLSVSASQTISQLPCALSRSCFTNLPKS